MDTILENINIIYTLITLASVGIAMRFLISFAGQSWVNNFSHSVTLILLPIITYSITSVISGNIALSLGMVGALSIVRFRHPVKSSFELIVYFLMISLGICAAVSLKWLAVLGGVSCVILFIIAVINRANMSFRGVPVFSASFTEGNSLNVVVIFSTNPIEELSTSNELVAFNKTEEGYTYRLATASRQKALGINGKYNSDSRVVDLSFTAA